MTTTQHCFTKNELLAIVDAFMEGRTVPTVPGCPLWFDGPNNLVFKAVERARPALLAVRTFDGAVNYRESDSEGSMHAENTAGFVNRGELKRHIIHRARQSDQQCTAIFKLTKQKANMTTLQRAVNFGDLDFGL